MSTQAAEKLAQGIADGTYVPSTIINCESRLEPDLNPHAVRFKQFVLLGSPRFDIRSPEPPEYLILRQFADDQPARRSAMLDRVVRPLSERLAADILADGRRPGAATEAPPNPDDERVDVDRLRTFALARGIAGYEPGWSERDVRDAVRAWTRTELPQRASRRLRALERAGFAVRRRLAGDLTNLREKISDLLSALFLPDPYQPFEAPYPHLAMCATFEQVWKPCGYTRGELINTISLAPGEQLTVEVHSWDKRTSRTEEELLSESELRVVENLTARDSRTVSREVAKNFSSSLDAEGVIPIKAATVTLAGNVSQSTSDTLRSTREQVRERTVQASNTLKTTRKLRIEVSREIGRERKQTHVISNTNRCNTLNCHFFEITANYLVTTRLLSVEPCLLLPGIVAEVTPEWVLAHEALLKEVLLSEVFLGGIEGARVLVTHEAFKEVKRDATNEEFGNHVGAILDAFKALNDSVAAIQAAAADPTAAEAQSEAGSQGQAAVVALAAAEEAQRVIYLARLRMNRIAFNALLKLQTDVEAFDAEDCLRNFFAAVRPRSFVPHPTIALSSGLSLLGIDPPLFFALVGWGYTTYLPDDAGLYNSVKAAYAKLKAFDASDTQEDAQTGFSFMEVARAEVAFEQLKAHIADNWVHYAQAAWLRESADQRFVRIQAYGAVAGILANDILGFVGHKVAFGISNPDAFKAQVDLAGLAQSITVPEEAPRLITVPTQGTILEASLGSCYACDDFIKASRDEDLRLQRANAASAEAEALRRELRLQQSPPNLDDPQGLRGSGVSITVNPTDGNPPG